MLRRACGRDVATVRASVVAARRDGGEAVSESLYQVIRRGALAVAMTLDYAGRFPRRKMFRLYWRVAAKL